MGQINSNNDASTSGVVGEAIAFGAATGAVILAGLGVKKGVQALGKGAENVAKNTAKKISKRSGEQVVKKFHKAAADDIVDGVQQIYRNADGAIIGEQLNFMGAVEAAEKRGALKKKVNEAVTGAKNKVNGAVDSVKKNVVDPIDQKLHPDWYKNKPTASMDDVVKPSGVGPKTNHKVDAVENFKDEAYEQLTLFQL